MSDDVLEALTPIGAEAAPEDPGRPRVALSAVEKRLHRVKNQANQVAENPHAMIHARARTLRSAGQYRAPLTVAEQIGMASTLAAEFFAEARQGPCECEHPAHPGACSACKCAEYRGQPRRLSESKHAATAWAIAMDKLSLVQGRAAPTTAGAPDLRPGLRELVRRLAERDATRQEQRPTAATSPQP